MRSWVHSVKFSSTDSPLNMPNNALVSWPPVISEEQRSALTLLATTYALSYGLVYLPVGKVQPPAPTSTIHAPLALFPSPIPRVLFDRARALQRTYNILYAKVATDVAFLDRVMGSEQGVGKADEFTGQLWRRWKRLREEGVVPVRSLKVSLRSCANKRGHESHYN